MKKSIELYKSVMGIKASDYKINQKRELFENAQRIEKSFGECLSYSGDEKKKDELLKRIDESIQKNGTNYIPVIQGLDENIAKLGSEWLLSIVEKTRKTVLKYLPSYA